MSTATRLPSGGEVPPCAAEFGDPHSGLLSNEGVAFHGVADGQELVAGAVHQLASGAPPLRIDAAIVGDLPLSALAG